MSAHYHSNDTALTKLVDQFPSRLQLCKADLTEEEDVKTLFTLVSNSKFGLVRVLVVSHSYQPAAAAPLTQISLDRWNYTVSTNLTSCFLVCREYLRKLEYASNVVKSGAAIVLVTSEAGKIGEVGRADAAATKSGM